MQGITFLKDLRNENVTLLQLLNSFVFGNKEVRPYVENRTYNTGDLIFRVNPNTNKIEVYQATEDNITGTFNDNKWTISIFNTNTNNDTTDTIVMVSETQPVIPNNLIWYCPLQYRTGTLPEPEIAEIENMAALFSFNAFPMVDETVPEGRDVGLFFDFEGMSEAEIDDTELEFEDAHTKVLDDPDNVVISDDPSYDPETVIWGDTDLTDNI